MKKSVLYILFALLLIGFLIWFFYQDDIRRFQQVQQNQAYSEQAQAMREGLLAKLAEGEKAKGEALSIKEMLNVVPKEVAKRFLAGNSFNQAPISFFGRVIDQYGEPVEGARVRMSFGASAFAGGTQAIMLTDEQGGFEVDTVGSALVIYSIDHPETSNFIHARKTVRGNKIGQGIHFHAIKKPSWTDHVLPEKPYIFKVWRYGEKEKIIKAKNWAQLSGDEQIYTIDLTKKKSVKGKVGGHIYVRFSVEDHRGEVDEFGRLIWDYPRDWWAEVEVINGSWQTVPEEDVYMNLAPESGYSSQPIKVGSTKSDEKFTRRLRDQRYYIKSNDNAYYGLLTLTYKPVTESNPFLTYEVKLNPNGSRNLEYYKEKR